MKTYIAHIVDHQSLIFAAANDDDALEWANKLKDYFYGACELDFIWDNDEKRRV